MRLNVSIASRSPIKVTHAFRRVKFHFVDPEHIFSTQIASIFLRLKNTSIANSNLDSRALQDKP